MPLYFLNPSLTSSSPRELCCHTQTIQQPDQHQLLPAAPQPAVGRSEGARPAPAAPHHHQQQQQQRRSQVPIERLRIGGCSVVEPEPPFLAGAGAVKKGAAPAPALQLKLQLHMTPCLKKRYNKNVNNNVN